jgi:hypothetical protein
MIEAVENHMPEVIIIDEIGTELEVLAARTIAEKGVQLVGTTHGNCLENLIKNPPLADLIGGIQYVTLSDDEAKRRGTQKSILERKAYPAFEIVIEINQKNSWTVHEDVKLSIDSFLRGDSMVGQVRQFAFNEKTKIKSERLPLNFSSFLRSQNYLKNNNWDIINQPREEKSLKLKSKTLVIYPYSLSNNLVKEVLLKMGFKFILTNEIRKASLIIGLKKHLRQNLKLKNLAQQRKIPIYSLNQVSIYQITKLVQYIK